ncbi:peptide ABC transporter substrate-binding protein [Scopulibacillus cellulosilyticus]|uniref:Peptide ABC transporter substrate-binding protein n=1 Tax=Scopulibacillus cellulosilyticus TaxID=2665665 RepID=A0ABW2PTK5_9BACL
MGKAYSRIAGFMILILMMSIFLSGCGKSQQTSGTKQGNQSGDTGELHLVSMKDVPTLDEAHATDSASFQVLYMTNAGLTRLDHGKVTWDMAEGKPQVKNNGKTYIFKIRNSAKWSDGSPVTANDFVYAWQREMNPKTGAEYNYIYSAANIKNAAKIMDKKDPLFGKVNQLGIKALDKHTLQIDLETPTPYFLNLLSTPPFFPEKEAFVKKQGKQYAQEPDKLLYNGPYVLSKWDHGAGWHYKRNPNYWHAKSIYINDVDVKVTKNMSTAVNIYKTGKADLIDLDSEYINQFKNTNEFHKAYNSKMSFLSLNIKGNKALQNKNIRQAISMAINRKDLTTDLLQDGSIPAKYIVPKQFVKGPDGKDFRASAPNGYLLGGKKDAKNLWDKGKKELGVKKLQLDYLTSDDETATKFTEYVANQLETTLDGLKINIVKLPYGELLKREDNGDFGILNAGWSPDYNDPMTYLEMFTSDNDMNKQGYNDPKFDKLIKQAKQMGDQPDKRWKDLQEAEKVLITDAPIIPLYQQGKAYVQKSYVEGIERPLFGPDIDWLDAKIVRH